VVKPSVASSWPTTSSTSSASMNSWCARRTRLLAALGSPRLLGQDVDVPAGQLRGEAHVLAAAADGERQLLVGHDHLDALGLFVEHHLGDFGRGQRVDDEGGAMSSATTE
jgi:hypothetical protein